MRDCRDCEEEADWEWRLLAQPEESQGWFYCQGCHKPLLSAHIENNNVGTMYEVIKLVKVSAEEARASFWEEFNS